MLQLIDSHVGLIVGALLVVALMVMYARGEMNGLFPWLGQAASTNGVPSSKNLGFLVAVATLCWGFVKVTLAVCRWVDKGNDPTYISIIYLGVVAALAGITKIFGMKYGQMNTASKEDPQ